MDILIKIGKEGTFVEGISAKGKGWLREVVCIYYVDPIDLGYYYRPIEVKIDASEVHYVTEYLKNTNLTVVIEINHE